MANDDQQKPARNPADKERSRQQSRAVSGKQAARAAASRPAQGAKGGKGAKGGGQRPAQGKGPRAQAGGGSGRSGRPRSTGVPVPPRRSPGSLITWGVVGLVIVIVVVLVVVKISSGSSGSGTLVSPGPVPATVLHDVTHIPASVYDSVGVSSPTITVTAPKVVNGKTLLKIEGKPGVFFLGGEFCPFCAAERWTVIASLSRFGTFSGLKTMESNPTDTDPSTQTFTFVDTKFTSSYLGADLHELYSNRWNSARTNHEILKPLDKSESKLVTTYDKGTSSTSTGSIPFMDIGNKIISSGASYTPSVLQGLSREQIASDLSDPSNPVTKAIITTANYQSASYCSIDGEQPASVCTSKGVAAAAAALKLKS